MADNRLLIIAVIVTSLLFCAVLVSAHSDDLELEGQVYILHTNDTHGTYEGNVTSAGLVGYKEYLESKGATVFTMDAGDYFQGSADTTLTLGASSLTVANAVRYDVMVPGNHEFDYTLEKYLEYVEGMDTTVICANLVWKDSGDTLFAPYTVLQKNGVRLGVFGLLTPETKDLTIVGGKFNDIDITDPVTVAKDMVFTLKDKGCDYIVALGHLGIDHSSTITSDLLCSEVEGIDVFIDGHSHTEMRHGRPVDTSLQFIESETVIASTGEKLNHMGKVTLGEKIDADLLDSDKGLDRDVAKVVRDLRASLDELKSKEICGSDIVLNGDRTVSRLQEVNFGDLVTDLFRKATLSDIAVINGGSLRSVLQPGKVTVGDLYTIVPYEEFVVTKDVNGSVIWEMMENSVSQLPDAKGRYLQVSGMEVTYDSSKPSGERIISVSVDGSLIDPDRTYRLASTAYVSNGGDGFTMLTDLPVVDRYGVVNKILEEQMSLMGTIKESDIRMGRLSDLASA